MMANRITACKQLQKAFLMKRRLFCVEPIFCEEIQINLMFLLVDVYNYYVMSTQMVL